MRSSATTIAVDDHTLAATVAAPATRMPGLLFVHGWNGSQKRDLLRAREIAQLGCICLTFDMRGHGDLECLQGDTTREHNLHDVLAAYDRLAAHPEVDTSSIAVVGSSYGGYLACILTSLRRVRWLALRVPALYRDADWDTPKGSLDRGDLDRYRAQVVPPEDNRALSACAAFGGDVLMVESQFDHLVPHPTIVSYMGAFRRARSMTYRMIEGADHGLTSVAHRRAYSGLLTHWVTEMVFGARRRRGGDDVDSVVIG
ncbi:alpha/beta hydrolase family protein [Coralloluteibacterium thermophilus]|uniref:Alpha/beta hydrolase family protein n=1 Tax=Coralloluteibacterium thermophilum TaxID=2707049 RepID=A0ABV9NNG4_9GAMM